MFSKKKERSSLLECWCGPSAPPAEATEVGRPQVQGQLGQCKDAENKPGLHHIDFCQLSPYFRLQQILLVSIILPFCLPLIYLLFFFKVPESRT